MRAICRQIRRQLPNRPAFALLMLLIVVVIGMLIYYFALSPVDRKTAREQKKSPDEYPWVEEWRIKDRKVGDAAEQPISEEQPKITEILEYSVNVQEKRNDRGLVSFTILPDGTVEGVWAAEYDTLSPRMNYTVVKAGFKGNTDPSKIYSDADGEDKSKLFFITKGNFLILETNFDNGKVKNVIGNIYVTGWINPDYSVTGKITITSDKKSLQAFQWQGQPLN
jgi:hypothetical protein